MDTFWAERRMRLSKEMKHPGWFRRFRCRIGLHYWWTMYAWVERKGYGKTRTCPYCRKEGRFISGAD